jgi:hypothetical protein
MPRRSVSVKAGLTASQQYPLPEGLSIENDLVRSRTWSIFEQSEPEIVSAIFDRRIANQSAKLDVPAVTGERVAAQRPHWPIFCTGAAGIRGDEGDRPRGLPSFG